jgi:glutamate dehydrogenase
MRSADLYESFVDRVDQMVVSGTLNRTDESIPRRAELLEMRQAGRGLPRPLLCVLLGYSKMQAFDALLATDFPDSEAGRPFLEGYFPQLLRERYQAYFQDHVLRREIIATCAVNHVLNHSGITLLPRLAAATHMTIGRIIEAYAIVERESGAQALRCRISDAGMSAREEQELLRALEDALEAAILDLLAGKSPDLKQALSGMCERIGS